MHAVQGSARNDHFGNFLRDHHRTHYKKNPPRLLCRKGVGGFDFPMKDSNEIVNGLKCLVQFFRVGPSRLRKIRATSPCSSNMKCDLFNQSIGTEPMGEVWSHSHDQGNFILALTSEKNNACSDLTFQLVNK